MRLGYIPIVITILMLVACDAVNTSQATSSVSTPSGTFTPVYTPTLTSSPSPTSHPDATSTSVPISATTTLSSSFLAASLPITGPIAGSDQYQIKSWTEAEAISAIVEAETVLSNFDNLAYQSFYAFNDFQTYLIMLEKETLFRFPESEYRSRIEWDLAYQEATNQAEAIVSNDYSLDRFISLLAEALNTDKVKLDPLEEWLRNQGFTITARYPALNLLGDGQLVYVLQVKAEGTIRTKGAILGIINDLQRKNYHIVPLLRERWFADEGGRREETIQVDDFNNNGQPEIASIITTAEHATCLSEIALYEWQNGLQQGSFANIAPKVSPLQGDYYHNDCNDVWSFETASSSESQLIVKNIRLRNWAGEDCQPYQRQVRYSWNGYTYQWISTDNIPFDSSQPIKCGVGWAVNAIEDSRYDQAIPILASALENWPVELDMIWGPGAQDYFRFKLGTWYALGKQRERAQIALQSIRDAPVHPEFELPSRMAETYLLNYQDESDLYGACTEIFQLLENVLPATPNNASPSQANEQLKRIWGFAEPTWILVREWDDVCSLRAAFRQTMRSFRAEDENGLESFLNEKKIPVWFVKRQNLMGYGSNHWLIGTTTTNRSYRELWALVEEKNELVAVLVSDASLLSTGDAASVSLDSLHLGEDKDYVNILKADDKVIVFRLFQPLAIIQAETLFANRDISNYEVRLFPGQAELIIYQPDTTKTYLWDSEAKLFNLDQVKPAQLEQQIAMLELTDQTLFQVRNVHQTLELLQTLFVEDLLAGSYLKEDEAVQAYLRYLLGLAYELSGDNENAVKTYWELWQKYPESPYTLIVVQKLELSGP